MSQKYVFLVTIKIIEKYMHHLGIILDKICTIYKESYKILSNILKKILFKYSKEYLSSKQMSIQTMFMNWKRHFHKDIVSL